MNSSYKFLWKTGHLRSFIEGWVGAAILLVILMPTIKPAPPLIISAFFILVIFVGDSIAGLRLKQSLGSKRQIIKKEILNSLAFGIVLFILIITELSLFGALDLPERSHIGLIGFEIFMLLISPGFLAVRGISALWTFWDNLRRIYIVWGLTHAILVVVASLGTVALLAGVVYSTGYDANFFMELSIREIFSRVIIWSLTLFIATLATLAVGIAVLLIPSAVFSYLVARRLTNRLGSLIVTVKALEQGDLSARVIVDGEDEVAMLQRTFNSMAAKLQSSTSELINEKEKVTGLLQVQQELTSGVSHELRTPAAIIFGFSESLRNRWQSDPPDIVSRDLQTVFNEAVRLKNILNDLLNLSQTRLNQFSIRLQPVSLLEPVKQTLNVFQPLAWELKKVEVTAELPEDLPMVMADSTRMEQILHNLVQNSLRHTSPGGLVAITVFKSDDWVKVEVADTGEGISQEDLPHIWEKFYQGNGAPGSKNDGIGMGLAIVKEFTEGMGGQVTVTSNPGQGCVFSLQFKIAK